MSSSSSTSTFSEGETSGSSETGSGYCVPDVEEGAEDVLIFEPPARKLRNNVAHLTVESNRIPDSVPYDGVPNVDSEVDLEALFPNRIYSNLMVAWRSVGWAEYNRELGTGAYGAVCLGFRLDDQDLLAEDRHLCAFKRVPCYIIDVMSYFANAQRQCNMDPNFKMIWNEVTILRCLSHANIVHMMDAFLIKEQAEKNNAVYLVLEYCDGSSLGEEIFGQENGKFAEPEARYYFKEIVSAVRHMHGKGICHGDIHSGNVIMKYNADGVSKKCLLTDFGLSEICWRRNAPDAELVVSESHSVSGHVAFMAPEHLTKVFRYPGDSNPYTVTGWTSMAGDVCNLGCLLSLMLSGGQLVDDAFLMPVSGQTIQDPETAAFLSKLSAEFADRPIIELVWHDAWMQKEVRVPALHQQEWDDIALF